MKNKTKIYKEVQATIYESYLMESKDLGDSYGKLKNEFDEEFPVSIIMIKNVLNKLETLMIKENIGEKVSSAYIKELLKEVSHYAILEIVERENAEDEKLKKRLNKENNIVIGDRIIEEDTNFKAPYSFNYDNYIK